LDAECTDDCHLDRRDLAVASVGRVAVHSVVADFPEWYPERARDCPCALAWEDARVEQVDPHAMAVPELRDESLLVRQVVADVPLAEGVLPAAAKWVFPDER
jgi:hypothetical protein